MFSTQHTARRLPLAAIILVVLLFAVAHPVSAAPGDLDPSFDSDGRVTTAFGATDTGRAVAIQVDGKIVVAGSTGVGLALQFAVARYDVDGSPDPSFNGVGRTITTVGAFSAAEAVAIQADGKIVVAGTTLLNPGDTDFAVVRYNTDGSLDTTFDSDGRVTTDFGAIETGSAVAIQADGKIVVAGNSGTGIAYDFAVARYNADGSLDGSFNGGGLVTTDINFGDDDAGTAVAIQADGKIVVAGFTGIGSDRDFAVVRYNTNGTLDISFDTDGKVTTDFGSNDPGSAVAIQADGKIVVAGTTVPGSGLNDFALARYDTDGSLDLSFDGDGRVTTDFGAVDLGTAVAIQADGKIVAAGTTGTLLGLDDSDFAVARYNADGSLDAGFDGDGRVTTDLGFALNDFGEAVAIQADGKIVAAGTTDANSGDFALVRYEGDPLGTIVIEKLTSPANWPGSFSFEAPSLDPPAFELAHGATRTFLNVPVGTYEVSEVDPSPDFLVADITCDDAGSASPSSAGGLTATVRVDPDETVTCTFTNELQSATAATLADFGASADRFGAVGVSWQTGSEQGVLGFHVYRAEDPQGELERVTDTLVPARGNAAIGARYDLSDRVAPGSYGYWLEAVNANGTVDRFGPAGVVVDVVRVLLPYAGRR